MRGKKIIFGSKPLKALLALSVIALPWHGCEFYTDSYQGDMWTNIEPTGDGGFVVIADKNFKATGHGLACLGEEEGDCDFYYSYFKVLKLDSHGSLEWTRTLEDSGPRDFNHDGYAVAIEEIAADMYVAVALIPRERELYIWLVALDGKGHRVWDRVFDDFVISDPWSTILVETLSDSTLLVAATGMRELWGDQFLFSFKVHPDGEITDRNFYSLTGMEAEIEQKGNMIHHAGGGFTLFGGGNLSVPFVMKMDEEGVTQWRTNLSRFDLSYDSNYHGQDIRTFPIEIRQTSSGFYGLTLYIVDGYPGGRVTPMFVELTSDGMITRKSAIEQNNKKLLIAHDDNYIAAGSKRYEEEDCLSIMKIQLAGGISWSKDYEGTCGVVHGRPIYDMDLTPDNGFVIIFHGNTVLKLDSEGHVTWSRTY